MKRFITTLLSVSMITFSQPALSAPVNMSLSQAYALALQHDPVLAQSKAQLQSASSQTTLAGSALKPQIKLNGQYQIANSSEMIGDIDSHTWSVSASLPLYNPVLRKRIAQAESQLNQSDVTLQDSEQTLILRVANQYFKTLLAQADLTLAEAQQASRALELERVKASHEVGLASLTDVLQSQSSYDLIQSTRLQQFNALNIAKEELSALIGQPVEHLQDIRADAHAAIQAPNMQTAEDNALSANLDIKQLQHAMQASESEIAIQKSADGPTLNLQASLSDHRFQDVAPAMTGMYQDRQDVTVGAVFEWPLYTGGAAQAKLAKARSDYQRLQHQLREVKQHVSLQSRIQSRQIENGLAQVRALSKAVLSNQAYLDAAKDSYKVGLADLLDVLTAETNAFNAKRNLTAAVYNLILAQLQADALTHQLDEAKLLHYEALLTDNTNSEKK